jgi:hypothetical protein
VNCTALSSNCNSNCISMIKICKCYLIDSGQRKKKTEQIFLCLNTGGNPNISVCVCIKLHFIDFEAPNLDCTKIFLP